jgi:hypothetical protein
MVPSFVVLRELHLYRILIYVLNGGPDRSYWVSTLSRQTNYHRVAYSTRALHSILIIISNASALLYNRFILCVITSLPTVRRASVLSTHSDVPPVTKTTMGADLLHALDIITVLGSNVLCESF